MSYFVLKFRNAFTPYRGRNPPNPEKRVSESKKKHFPPPQKRVFRVNKSPFSLWCAVKKWGFLTQSALSLGGKKWVFLMPEPSFPDFGGGGWLASLLSQQVTQQPPGTSTQGERVSVHRGIFGPKDTPRFAPRFFKNKSQSKIRSAIH